MLGDPKHKGKKNSHLQGTEQNLTCTVGVPYEGTPQLPGRRVYPQIQAQRLVYPNGSVQIKVSKDGLTARL